MGTIQGVARFKIHPGKLAEFKRLSAACLQLTREKDTGTLRYEIFFSSDQTECVVHEEYVNSEASVKHLENMGENAAAIFAITDVEGEIWGDPSSEVRKSVESQGIKVFLPFLSFNEQ